MVSLCIPLLLLGSKSVKTFSRQQGIVEGAVLNVVRELSKESKRLVLRITSCY
jgi:hypothetical protein